MTAHQPAWQVDAELTRHGERAISRLEEMRVGLSRIQELVTKLRTFSRLDEGERKLVSVRESVESVLSILQHRLGERVRVITHFGERWRRCDFR